MCNVHFTVSDSFANAFQYLQQQQGSVIIGIEQQQHPSPTAALMVYQPQPIAFSSIPSGHLQNNASYVRPARRAIAGSKICSYEALLLISVMLCVSCSVFGGICTLCCTLPAMLHALRVCECRTMSTCILRCTACNTL